MNDLLKSVALTEETLKSAISPGEAGLRSRDPEELQAEIAENVSKLVKITDEIKKLANDLYNEQVKGRGLVDVKRVTRIANNFRDAVRRASVMIVALTDITDQW